MSDIREDICTLAKTLRENKNPDETLAYIEKIKSRLDTLERKTNQEKTNRIKANLMQSFIELLKLCECNISQTQRIEGNTFVDITIPDIVGFEITGTVVSMSHGFMKDLEMEIIVNDYTLTFRQVSDNRYILVNTEGREMEETYASIY